MKNIRLIITALLLLLLVGCHVTPYGVYDLRISDKSAETLWLNGKELLKLSSEEAEIIVNYDTSQHGMLLFDLSILNKSSDLMLITPEKFYCKTVNRLKEELQINAVNPELMIHKYNKVIERLDAQKSSSDRENLVFSMFDLADSFQSKTDEEREKERQKQRDYEESQERRDRNNISSRESAAEKKKSFETEALRKTSLLPGQKLSGRIYFAIKGSLTEFTLNLPLNNEEFTIKYDIEKM